MELLRSTEIQLNAMELLLHQQRDASIILLRIYKVTGKAPSTRCYAPGIVAFKHEWSKTAQENSKKYHLHIYEKHGQFIEGHDEASCRAGTRYRIADCFPDLWHFKDVWRWLKQFDLREGVGEDPSSFGHESVEKLLEDKEQEMKRLAEHLARQRTEADVAARSRGETVAPYFSIHKHPSRIVGIKNRPWRRKETVLGERAGSGGKPRCRGTWP
jgi:hypothetical protein